MILMLVLILIASYLFTNALEHFGNKIKISAGVTGSIFAAISTALPETSIPILALIAGGSNKALNEEVSVGAILGASLMLSTLSVFIMGLFALKKRGIMSHVEPENTGFKRDLNYFILAYILALLAMFLPQEPFSLRVVIGILLVMLYVAYVYFTCKASKKLVSCGHGVNIEEPLILTRIGCKNNFFTIILQLIAAFVLLIFAAKGFINDVEYLSTILQVSALILSLLIIPIATELPEKMNSVIWIRKNKDTLAFGNITGAMVFQGTLLPALGIFFTHWKPNRIEATSIMIAMIASIWMRFNARPKGFLTMALCVNGFLYFTYLCFVFIDKIAL